MAESPKLEKAEMRRGSRYLAGKLKDCVPRFNGRGDVETWLTQLEAAAKTIGLSEEEYANGALLLLDGPAFAAVARLGDEARCSVRQVRTCLRKAFAKRRFTAFEEFMQRDWRPGETACVYELELRKLATQAKMEDDAVILNRFVTGMPSSVNRHLRLWSTVASDQLDEIVAAAEELLAEGADERVETVHAAASSNNRDGRRGQRIGRRQAFFCFRCGEEGHFARKCKKAAAPEEPENCEVGPFAPVGSANQR